MSITKAIYLVYDFGFRADYERLYIWLDSLGAKECGGNVALIEKTFESADPDFIYNEIREEIKQNVNLDKKDRFYISFMDNDGRLRGKFLFGGRKRANWVGFAKSGDNKEDFL